MKIQVIEREFVYYGATLADPNAHGWVPTKRGDPKRGRGSFSALRVPPRGGASVRWGVL